MNIKLTHKEVIIIMRMLGEVTGYLNSKKTPDYIIDYIDHCIKIIGTKEFE